MVDPTKPQPEAEPTPQPAPAATDARGGEPAASGGASAGASKPDIRAGGAEGQGIPSERASKAGDAEQSGGGGEPPDDGEDEALSEEPSPEELRRQKWDRLRRRAREHGILAGKTLIVIALFVFVIFYDRIIHSVYPGEAGVLWSRFFGGTVLDKSYGEGLVITFPWDQFYKYDIREQELERDTVIYAQDGLEITIHSSVRFRLLPRDLPRLHQEVGPGFVEKIIVPETISTLRRVLGNYTPEMIYAKDEQGLLGELARTLRAELDARYFVVTEFLVLELRLPETIETAIKDKLTQEQRMLSYRFRLETEKDEKERRIIEAEGLKAFETISGVPILKWRGIEATEALAQSPSSKIVLMGTGSNQLPIILNADTNPAPAPAPVAPVESSGWREVPRPRPPLPTRRTPAPVPAAPPSGSAESPAPPPVEPAVDEPEVIDDAPAAEVPGPAAPPEAGAEPR